MKKHRMKKYEKTLFITIGVVLGLAGIGFGQESTVESTSSSATFRSSSGSYEAKLIRVTSEKSIPVMSEPVPISEPLPDKLPIGSIAALKSYALEQVRGAWISVNSASLIRSGRNYARVEYVPGPLGPRMTEIAELVKMEKLSFEVSDVRDYLSAYIAYQNSDGWTLFDGGQSFLLEYGKEGWVVPEHARKVVIDLVHEVPITLGGLASARIIERGEKGEIVRFFSPRVYEGRLLFPTYFAGRNGELILDFSDDRVGVYLLSKGSAVPPIGATSSFEPVVRDTLAFRNTNYVYVVPEELENPLVELTLTVPTAVSFYAQVFDKELRQWEIATGGWLRSQGSLEWEFFLLKPESPALLDLGTGVHYIVFRWKKFGTNAPPRYFPPYEPFYPGKG